MNENRRFLRIALRPLLSALIAGVLTVSCFATPGVITAEGGLRLRSSASTSAAVIASLPNGSTVEVLETEGDWYRVRSGQQVGYVSKEYVRLSGSTTATGYTTDQVNVRKGPGTNQTKIGSLTAGTKVEILSTDNGWHKIKSGDLTGYVSADYVSNTNPGTTTKTGYTTAKVNVRKGPGTNQTKIGSLTAGTMVEILSTDNGWHKVKSGSVTGYVSADYISDTKPGTTTKTGYTTAKVNVRKGPGTDQDKVTVLATGTEVQILSTADGWHKIKSGDVTGYISADYISDTKPSTATTTTKTGYTTVKVNVRKGPGTDQDKVTVLDGGTKVEILSTDNGWHKIKAGSVTGYISADYISDTKPSGTDTKNYGTITAGSLNVRKGPGSSYAKLTSLSSGTKVEVLGTTNNWYHIKSGSVDGYVSTKYVQLDEDAGSIPKEQAPAAEPTTAPSENEGGETPTQSQVVSYARKFVGYPYVLGAKGPRAFDCSGLVYYVYKHFGYTLNRTATQQLQNGTAVSKKNLQPGDLVFFNSSNNNPARATHVGIYIGDGKFVHASSPKVGVVISSLNTAYYTRVYTTARRIL